MEEREYDSVFFKNSPFLNILKFSKFRKIWIHYCIYAIMYNVGVGEHCLFSASHILRKYGSEKVISIF